MVVASLRAGMMATTAGQRAGASGSEGSRWSVRQNWCQKSRSPIHTASDRSARMVTGASRQWRR